MRGLMYQLIHLRKRWIIIHPKSFPHILGVAHPLPRSCHHLLRSKMSHALTTRHALKIHQEMPCFRGPEGPVGEPSRQRFPLCHVTHNVIDQWCGSVHCVLRLLSLNISSSSWQQLEQLAQPDHLRLQPSPLLSAGRAYSKRGRNCLQKDTGSSPDPTIFQTYTRS